MVAFSCCYFHREPRYWFYSGVNSKFRLNCSRGSFILMPREDHPGLTGFFLGYLKGHWRFPGGKEMQGYAYILTHPGTPAVFYDHIFSHYQSEIASLISLRNRNKVHCRSTVSINWKLVSCSFFEIHDGEMSAF